MKRSDRDVLWLLVFLWLCFVAAMIAAVITREPTIVNR